MFWNRNNDAWLSLVERCVRDAEAAGSNPVASTLGRGARRPVDACSAPTGTECRAGNRLDKGFPVLFIFCRRRKSGRIFGRYPIRYPTFLCVNKSDAIMDISLRSFSQEFKRCLL